MESACVYWIDIDLCFMADNYIERRMEELRSGALARKSTRPNQVAPSMGEGMVTMRYPRMRVLVCGAGGPLCERLVRVLRDTGFRVAFTCSDDVRGTELARATGSQFHNIIASDSAALEGCLRMLVRNWHDVDVMVLNCAEAGSACPDALAASRVVERLHAGLPLSPLGSVRYIELSGDMEPAGGRPSVSNRVICGSGCSADAVALVCRFMMHPSNAAICGAVIPVMGNACTC